MAGKASREGGSGALSSPCPPLSLEVGARYCGGRPTPECYSPQQQHSPNPRAAGARPVATLSLLLVPTPAGVFLRTVSQLPLLVPVFNEDCLNLLMKHNMSGQVEGTHCHSVIRSSLSTTTRCYCRHPGKRLRGD